MTDIVERLALLAAFNPPSAISKAMEEAADEIEWLRGERNRLAGDLGKAQRDAVAWIERAGLRHAEICRLRAALEIAADCLHDLGAVYGWAAARAALGEARDA